MRAIQTDKLGPIKSRLDGTLITCSRYTDSRLYLLLGKEHVENGYSLRIQDGILKAEALS